MDKNSLNPVTDIVDEQRIHNLLNIANRRAASLKIRLDKSEKVYSSTIIDVDGNNNSLTLELLRPDAGNALLNNSEYADIELFLNSSKLSWRSKIFKEDYTSIPDFFQVSIPEHIVYTQQRSAYRIEPADDITIVLSHPEFGTIHGALVNLSVDGVAAKIPEHFIHGIDSGGFYQDCLMQLPGHNVLCSVEVRHKDEAASVFGARFCSLSRLQQHTVAEYIAEADRMAQRNSLNA